jgi:hypothetical protein
MTTQEAMIANDKQVNEQAEEDQESGSRQANTTDKRSKDQRIIDLTDEIDTEPNEGEEADDEHCNYGEDKGAMEETMQETRLSEQETSSIEYINDFISSLMPI